MPWLGMKLAHKLAIEQQSDSGNKADSDATVKQVQAHNARYRSICP